MAAERRRRIKHFATASAQPKWALQDNSIIDLTAQLTDFVETAALVCCLDLVMCQGAVHALVSG